MKKTLTILIMGYSALTVNAQTNTGNPLLKEWAGLYGGVPAFNEYKIADFKPAFTIAIAEKLNEINVIANNPKPPTFENTIVALENCGKTIARIYTIYGIYSSNINSSEFEPVETEMAPILSDQNNKVYQNNKLFLRIEKLYNSADKEKLNSEQQRLIWYYYTDFVKQGAKLDQKTKEKVGNINKELAGLFTKFNQNLLAEERNQYVALINENDFDGLPTEIKAITIAEAKDRKLTSLGCITNMRSSIEPFLTYSNRRDLREKAWNIFIKRGDNGNSNDNNTTVTAILKLRTEKAKLLGFPTFAHWSLSNTMAKEPQKTLDLMQSVWTPAVEKVHQDVKEMQTLADSEGVNFAIAPWDYRYYAEKVRKQKYDLDQNEVKQYLQLEKLREGMFWVAGELFNLAFKQVSDVPVFHPDVRVWEVSDKLTSKTVGLWYFDPYAGREKVQGHG